MELSDKIYWAAQNIRSADALVFTAGAGMGVDSGLPDFRGNDGFWKAYPPYKRLNLSFSDLANPTWFKKDPNFAWGFYGHRLGLYRKTQPHVGYDMMLKWGNQKRLGYQVYTSNVDGAFRKAGFNDERIVECHGRIDLAQCVNGCGVGIFPVGSENVEVDEITFKAKNALPSCQNCGSVARPNILMFDDWNWDTNLVERQKSRMSNWLRNVVGKKIAIIECGAGLAIPSVRFFGERLLSTHNAKLIRINVRDSQVSDSPNEIGIPLGALEALTLIQNCLEVIV